MNSTIKERFYNERPTIGMKRNFAISALTEIYGEADYIMYADDDDFRSNSYVHDLINGINNYDFARFCKYYVWSIVNDFNLFGVNNITFSKDANDNWFLSNKIKNKNMINTTKNYSNTIQNKYSTLIGLSFPFIAFEGATHVFKYSIWKYMLKYTNGVPITSMCEDILFFKECKKYLNNDFKETQIKLKTINFLRVNNGSNSSVIEWTKNIKYDNLPEWVKDIVGDYKKTFDIKNLYDYYENLYNNFINYNTIIF